MSSSCSVSSYSSIQFWLHFYQFHLQFIGCFSDCSSRSTYLLFSSSIKYISYTQRMQNIIHAGQHRAVISFLLPPFDGIIFSRVQQLNPFCYAAYRKSSTLPPTPKQKHLFAKIARPPGFRYFWHNLIIFIQFSYLQMISAPTMMSNFSLPCIPTKLSQSPCANRQQLGSTSFMKAFRAVTFSRTSLLKSWKQQIAPPLLRAAIPSSPWPQPISMTDLPARPSSLSDMNLRRSSVHSHTLQPPSQTPGTMSTVQLLLLALLYLRIDPLKGTV